MRPFNFMIPFWGERYRGFFVDRCLPSLLAPNNLPLLNATDGHRFLIATTRADWDAIKDLPIMQRLRRHATPEPIIIDDPSVTPPGSVAAVMQQNHCQKLLIEAAYKDRTYACMLWPDVIFSDGTVAALRKRAEEGCQLVLCASLRHVEETVLAELQSRDLLSASAKHSDAATDMPIPPRLLADISVRHLHPEVLVYDGDSPELPVLPPFIFWRIDGNGIIIHSFAGQPLLMDYAAIERHDTACLDTDIFENVYLDRNFSSKHKVHIVSDSDELGLLSLTPAAVGQLPEAGAISTQWSWSAWIRRLLRLRVAMAFHTHGGRDALRRTLFRVPIRWHAADVDATWERKEQAVGALLDRVVGDYYDPARANVVIPEATRFPVRPSLNPWRMPGNVYLLYIQYPYLSVIIDALIGDRKAWSRIVGSIGRRFGGRLGPQN